MKKLLVLFTIVCLLSGCMTSKEMQIVSARHKIARYQIAYNLSCDKDSHRQSHCDAKLDSIVKYDKIVEELSR